MQFDFDKDWGAQLKEAYEKNEKISEEDAREIICNRSLSISHGSGRWMEHKTALFECEGFFYGLEWDQGLTECQENEYWSQVPKKYEKVEVKTYEYREVK